MSASWESSAQDFGQKVDLTVRIREILRNYPEGLSILKELIQNADDAGARTVRFCAAAPRPRSSADVDQSPLSQLMEGPSLLAYNSASFTDTDFKSIQRIGDSLKKDAAGTKTGRFGVGVNSTYHLTDVPLFVSGQKVVLFDPQASYVPGIHPANPGKMVDLSTRNGRNLVASLPAVFSPLNIFGAHLEEGNENFDGTTFRFALRTPEAAATSRLSRQSHSLEQIRDLLKQMAEAASSMLLFLKHVECIEIYDWPADQESPLQIHSTSLQSADGESMDLLRRKRSYVITAPTKVPSKPQAVDYVMDMTSSGIGVATDAQNDEHGNDQGVKKERWIVCNQLGGGNASRMAQDPGLSHMKLIPWAGVAARLSPLVDDTSFEGAAYCFLPLPAKTKLPCHVNGYFELSSNRRDVWWGEDMAGDGRARADWNYSLLADLAMPSYCRLVAKSISAQHVSATTYEQLFPPGDDTVTGPWRVLSDGFFSGIRNLPVLYNSSSREDESLSAWIKPMSALLLDRDDDDVLATILQLEKLRLVLLQRPGLRQVLLKHATCTHTSSPAFARSHFRNESREHRALLEDNKLEYAEHLLKHCLTDLDAARYGELKGCPFIPLADRHLGTFRTLPVVDPAALQRLQAMGFSKLACLHSLRINQGNVDVSFEWLLERRFNSDREQSHDEVEPYLLCEGDGADLLRTFAAHTFVDTATLTDPILRKFFSSEEVATLLNVVPLVSDMLADVVSRVIPADWKGADSAPWNPSSCDTDASIPSEEWFKRLWRYICSSSGGGDSLGLIAEQFCIVPTQEGVVCSLSPGSSVMDASHLSPQMKEAVISLGGRTFCEGVLPTDIVVPKTIWSYLFPSTRDGVIKAIETAMRRHVSTTKDGSTSPFESVAVEVKSCLYDYLRNDANGAISNAARETLRTFPIFRVYYDDYNTKTKYVALIQTGSHFVLEGATAPDRTLMTSEFLYYETETELNFLMSIAGVKKMNRSQFYMRFVLPQLVDLDPSIGHQVIETVLTDLPSLCAQDHTLEQFLVSAKFVPTAETQTLKIASELYDPDVPQLKALMHADCFPDERFCTPELLMRLRSLGLQTSLTWDVVLDCAETIEQQGEEGIKDPIEGEAAKARGKELLNFLDSNFGEFFPNLAPKKKAKKTSLLRRVVKAALFDDTEKKQRDAELQAERTTKLLSTKWMPVHTESPHPCLPWKENHTKQAVAAPVDTILVDKMWLASYSRRIVDGDVHSKELQTLFGWHDAVPVSDVATQLRMFGHHFDLLSNSEKMGDNTESSEESSSVLRQTMTSEIPRLYNILNNVRSQYEVDVVRSKLHGCAWLWMGTKFVSPDHAAFTSSINAVPYLFTVPPDLAVYRSLLKTFGVRDSFGSSDFCDVLRVMANEQNDDDKDRSDDNARRVAIAINLVQALSDDVLKLKDIGEIYAPSEDGRIVLASVMVYDDAPWLSKNLPGKKDLIFVHPKISVHVAEKIGSQSVRTVLLQDKADTIDFGGEVVHESFSQSESLTRRLRNIIEMYPEGPQQLSELIQNADDARATVVKFVISHKHHGESSLLGQKLSAWQGPALLCYNDATFTDRDFQNLARIGQASKLEKLATTGRFGLGFNSVFHWTDVPSIVSGDFLVMFDPHGRYVPGNSKGIKIRFTDSSLHEQFPDQMSPYCHFGCDMQSKFQGTLFRFPFRTESTAAESEISKTQCAKDGAIDGLVDSFKKVISKYLLFLRNVKRIEVYTEGPNADDKPQLAYFAAVTKRDVVYEKTANANSATGWNSITDFIKGPQSHPLTKQSFYSKLQRTPVDMLPKTKHVVSIQSVYNTMKPDIQIIKTDNEEAHQETNDSVTITDEYLICMALGGGSCRTFACEENNRDLKLLPWGGCAALIRRDGSDAPLLNGNAFCGLPLPAQTMLPLHLNGMFELSANRRDIWYGDDMSGQGEIRSKWNRLLLSDVIAPLYMDLLLAARQLLGPGKQYNSLFPVHASNEVWKLVKASLYRVSQDLPVFYSKLNGGIWVTPNSAIVLDEKDDENNENTCSQLMNILLEERANVVALPTDIIGALKDAGCRSTEVSPDMIRQWFKKQVSHPSLQNRSNALFLLKYCSDDLRSGLRFHELNGLHLVPLCNGKLGEFKETDHFNSCNDLFVGTEIERDILLDASERMVDIWTPDADVNILLTKLDLHAQTNLSALDQDAFVSLLSHAYPQEWTVLSEVRWSPSESALSGPASEKWIISLWEYIAKSQSSVAESNAEESMHNFVNTWQILPSLVGERERTLSKLSYGMGVVSLINPLSGTENINEKISHILMNIGIRVLDISLFMSESRLSILRRLEGFVQPPTVAGVLLALCNSLPSDILDEDLIRRVGLRCKFLSTNERDLLRGFLRDPRHRDGAFDSESVRMLKALPIFRVYTRGGGKAVQFENLLTERFLPPTDFDSAFLDETFVNTTSQRDVELLELLGVRKIGIAAYFERWVCPRIIEGNVSPEVRDSAINKLLQQDLSNEMANNSNDLSWKEQLSDMQFIPNRNGDLVRARDLYDPTELGTTGILDGSMLPAKPFCHIGALSSLRLLGLKTRLTASGVLESARSIETLARSDTSTHLDNHIEIVQKRALCLLGFLDKDETIQDLLDEQKEEDDGSSCVSFEEAEETIEGQEVSLASEASKDNWFLEELNSIAWLPVEQQRESGSTASLPRKTHALSHAGIAAPNATRPKEDEWLCSSSMETLCTNLRSTTLTQCFGWHFPVPVAVVARQLLDLAQLHENNQKDKSLRAKLATVIPRCYEILNDTDSNEVSELLRGKPWIWVGSAFVSSDQVAFDCPETARPYLFCVPEEICCFDTLLNNCGVKDKFCADDFVSLSMQMKKQVGNHAASQKQIDMIIFVTKYLSEFPEDELNSIEKDKMYLPSRDGKIYCAVDMTFDDAPWLSRRVSERTRDRYRFVHDDISTDVAQLLGAKSLRDALSAHQNGMVKIPCPKSDSLARLLGSRAVNAAEHYKAILDLLEVGEMHGVKQVSIVLDRRTHDSTSLVHPCLGQAQGPALVICFHDVVLHVEEIVKLTSPSNLYSGSVHGNGGSGGTGFPRCGKGLCGSFLLTDCLQVISGASMLFFDPNGDFFVDGNVKKEKKTKHPTSMDASENVPQPESPFSPKQRKTQGSKASARNYSISKDFVTQFPDQLEPFLSLPFGVKESLLNSNSASRGSSFRGTIFRLPLRNIDGPPSNISDHRFEEKDVCAMMSQLESKAPLSFLFTYHLQSISVDEILATETVPIPILRSTVSGSPITRRSHIDELVSNQEWAKGNSKFSKLFKSTWVAEKSSYTLQISHRHQNEPEDIIDTFVIQSTLAPPRFREMACTEALKPLNLIPAITISAHVHSTQGASTTEFQPPKGTLFVGLDTGISTGLPFHINAPLFLHELTGSVLLEKDDDADFRKLFPGIRNVEIKGKNGTENRALALYVWNRQAITSAMKELIPSMLADLRDPLQLMYSRDVRLLYRYWPFFSRIRSKFQPLMPKEVYTELANSNVKLFLTEKGDFCGVKDGYFTSSDHAISGRVAEFFNANITILKVPYRIFDDLKRFDIPSQQLTPSTVRSVLKTQVSHARWLANRPDDALQLLEYCLSDLASVENIAEDASANHICRSEIRGLVLMPLADGSVGTMGRSFIVASAQQQRLLPTITNKFMSISAMQRLETFLKKPGFMNAIDLVKFTPQVLANHMFSVLPRAWEGKDFVDWFVNHSSGDVSAGIPSPAWLFQFWKEVPIWNHDTVQLFRRWPLIPTTSGQLASCGNARFILCFSPQSQNDTLNASLESENELTQQRVEDIGKRELLRISAENRTGDKTTNGESISEADTHFRCMGEKDDEDEQKTITASGASEREPELLEENIDEDITINGNGIVLQNDEATAAVSENAIITHTESVEVNTLPLGEEYASSNATGTGTMDTTPSVDTPSSVVPPHEADGSSIQCLHQILAKVRCPIIESAFFCNADISKILPVDHLVLARSVLTTLTQSANYWHQIRPEESRLQWSLLSDEEFDSLVLLLYKNQGTRLSLMPSDLTLLRGLPIFQTISGERVSLKERHQHFRLADSVNLGSLEDCLPESIKSKFLIDKSEFQDLLEDIGVETVNDATLLQKFILPEFHLMPFTKKEAVCRVILSKWSTLGDSNEFVLVLKDSPFIKRQSAATGGEVVWAKAKDMLDPRHEFFSLMFDDDQSKFPTEEFGSDEWLTILAKLGLMSTVDKDTFIECALRVEAQDSIQKAMELHKYYVANFGEFYDSNQSFSGRLSGIKCVPADFDGCNRSLYKFSDVAVPKDRDMVFKVLPVIPDSIAPPQVMFSSLGIMSPPSVASVLKQVRELTQDIDSLDHWTYKFGSVEKVFGSIFSFLQENYDHLSPLVQNGLRDRPLVPVGTTLVKASQLFFRLTKDLAPFFFEVPRAFGAYDRLLRDLGACDSPSAEDYASSLVELKSELGDGKLNANELQSSIEICNLVANEDITHSRDSMFAPDSRGILVDTDYLVEDDCPWLTQSERLDLRLIHLTHPKLSGELCRRLKIGRLSERVDELFEDGFCPVPVNAGNKSRIENMLKCDSFIETMNKLIDTNSSRSATVGDTLRSFSIVQVENLRTRFIMKSRQSSTAVDITQNPIGTFAFIEGNNVYVSKTPTGLSSEMVVATSLCDYFHLDRKNVACLSAMLASNLSTVSVIGKTMGLVGTIGMDEALRGTPGHPCNDTDLELIELKPLKYYTKGEIVALREGEGSPLIYGNVIDYGGGSSLSRVRVRIGKGAIIDVLSSQIFSFRRGVKATRESAPVQHVDVSSLPGHATGVMRRLEDESNEFESSLVSTNVNPSESLGQVSRREIIGAVQDLLRSADLSLDDDVKNMLESNLELREELSNTKTLLLNTTDSGVQLGKDLSKGQEALLCPITREIMTDPVICCDGHTYEREAITQWFRSNSRSPKTNQELASRVLIPNHAMRNTIESMSESMKAVKKFVDMYGNE